MIFGSFYIHGKKIRHQEKKYTRAHTKIRLHTDARLFLSHFHWEEEDKSKDMSHLCVCVYRQSFHYLKQKLYFRRFIM